MSWTPAFQHDWQCRIASSKKVHEDWDKRRCLHTYDNHFFPLCLTINQNKSPALGQFGYIFFLHLLNVQIMTVFERILLLQFSKSQIYMQVLSICSIQFKQYDSCQMFAFPSTSFSQQRPGNWIAPIFLTEQVELSQVCGHLAYTFSALFFFSRTKIRLLWWPQQNIDLFF